MRSMWLRRRCLCLEGSRSRKWFIGRAFPLDCTRKKGMTGPVVLQSDRIREWPDPDPDPDTDVPPWP